MRLEVSKKAQRDIDAFHAYGVREFGKIVADGYARGLLNLFDLLELNPRMAAELPHLKKGLRILVYRSHLVIYRLNSRNIRVLRVPHSKQNWREFL